MTVTMSSSDSDLMETSTSISTSTTSPFPSTAKHANAVQTLEATTSLEDVYKAVRFIKNSIIGNPTKKRLYLHKLNVGPRLAQCLHWFPDASDLQIEIAAVFCSLAHSDLNNIGILIDAGALEALLSVMSSADHRVVDAAARGLRALVQYPLGGKSNLFRNHIHKLVSLLTAAQTSESTVSVHIGEVVACIIGKVAASGDNLDIIRDSGATMALLQWLGPQWSNYPRVQNAVLDALANLTHGNLQISSLVGSINARDTNSPVNIMFTLLRDKRAYLRLSAASCLTNLYRMDCLPRDRFSDVKLILLPALIKMFEDTSNLVSGLGGKGQPTVQENSIKVFSRLIEDSQELQGLAMEGDAIVRLAQILLKVGAPAPISQDDNKATAFISSSNSKASPTDAMSPASVVADLKSNSDTNSGKLLENGLLAVAAVSSLKEECRRQVIDAKLLPVVIEGLSHRQPGVREAACRCARSLSRSVKNLRTSLMDAGIAEPLLALLYDENVTVQIMASATLCNIVLDFSPMKKSVLEKGGVKRLVELVHAKEKVLRLNAVWALKNILFQADSDTKGNVMTHLGWDMLSQLLDDPEVAIQEQAINLVRNLACGKVSDVEVVFNGFGNDRILVILETKLSKMIRFPEIILQALYTLVNLAVGDDGHKKLIMNHATLLSNVISYMNHESPQLRVAAIWCVINLTWPDEANAAERIEYFKSVGATTILAHLVNDENGDVKERAKTALGNLQGPIIRSDSDTNIAESEPQAAASMDFD